jgi:hypothetical protein
MRANIRARLHFRERRPEQVRKLPVWTVCAFVCLGLAVAGVVTVLVRGGGGPLDQIALFGFVFPFFAVCAMTALAVLGVDRISLRKPAIWVADAFVFFGLAVAGVDSVLVLGHGGPAAEMIAHLAFVFPVGVVCVMTALAVLGVGRIFAKPMLFLWATVVAGVLGNLVIPFLALRGHAFYTMIPRVGPAGADFRDGLYNPAAVFSTAKSAWPPLTLVLGRPFTVLGRSSGYIAQVVLLGIMGIAAAALSASIAMRAARGSSPQTHGVGRSAQKMVFLLAFWLVTSYGFMLELERGQTNVYALFFSVLAVWCLLRHPKAMWLSIGFLAVAINIKIYPAILLILVFWRYRWRAVLPVVVSNAALLMIAGPSNAGHFLNNLRALESTNEIWQWPVNASANNYAIYLRDVFGWLPTWTNHALLAVTIALWAVTAVILIRRGWSHRGAVLLAAASMPLMITLPTVSHDYKLPMMVFPLAVLASLVTAPATAKLDSPVLRGALWGLLSLEMILLSAPTLLFIPGEEHGFLGNKYPLLVLLQLLLLGVALLLGRNGGRVPGGPLNHDPGFTMSGPGERRDSWPILPTSLSDGTP